MMDEGGGDDVPFLFPRGLGGLPVWLDVALGFFFSIVPAYKCMGGTRMAWHGMDRQGLRGLFRFQWHGVLVIVY